jgi:hypothetical protein
LKVLEDENAKLKTLLAEAMLDVAMLKDLNGKKFWRPLRGVMPWPISSRPMRSASGGGVKSSEPPGAWSSTGGKAAEKPQEGLRHKGTARDPAGSEPALVAGTPDRVALDRAGKAAAERAHRELQRQAPG